jgi:hypothetical protein
MLLGDVVSKDFVGCLRRDLGFSPVIKKLATDINRIRGAISYKDATCLIRIRLFNSRAMISACTGLLLRLSIQYNGYIDTALWSSTVEDDSDNTIWHDFLMLCARNI